MSTIQPTDRTTLRRRPQRGSYDRALINSILDEAIVCHVGFTADAQPYVLPMAYARVEERIYLHGAVSNRMLKAVRAGAPLCITVTLLDALVLARSAFHQSVNYRSVVVLGAATEVTDTGEKRAALDAIVEHTIPGRLGQVRAPTPREVQTTTVLSVPILEVSAKVRGGPPIDDEEDYARPCWAGIIPLAMEPQTPIADPRMEHDLPAPSLEVFRRKK